MLKEIIIMLSIVNKNQINVYIFARSKVLMQTEKIYKNFVLHLTNELEKSPIKMMNPFSFILWDVFIKYLLTVMKLQKMHLNKEFMDIVKPFL